jgi:hypothetical protein
MANSENVPPLHANEDKIYDVIHGMVIWDQPKEDIFRVLEANGLTGARAAELYEMARADRISTIRALGLKRAVIGLTLLAAGVGAFVFFWYVAGFINRGVLGLCCVAAVFGFWKLTDGMLNALMAGTKRGSLADGD